MKNYEALQALLSDILQQDVPNSISGLKKHLAACVKLVSPVLQARCTLQCQLASEKNRLRMPKDKEYTDFDRQIMLDAAVADLQQDYELFKGYEAALLQRIEIISGTFLGS